MKRARLRGGFFVGQKARQERPVSKTAVAGNKGGSTGHGSKPAQHRKQHLRATGRPGSPNGVCLGPRAIAHGEVCRCGTHNRRSA